MENNSLRKWSVVGGIIRKDDDILLVANRRRGSSNVKKKGGLDWSPPGGVIDDGEDAITALGREVFEETGLQASGWSEAVYAVEVDFATQNMFLYVEVFEALKWSGSFVFTDPDGIVENAEFFSRKQCETKLEASPIWVREPLTAYMYGELPEERIFAYRATVSKDKKLIVERTS